ncbi:putative RNA polymerase Rpb4 [Lyophyllum shimeji]|uniref:DNA-directed RNA polymerase III subunit RPC9 n=1 Tax=Lyophyllum shimeji TaxID=47721 RepID=A0A9P3PLS0_LYOSH|nr:putative RNA polymerase Rpb4 [Lyophyllum shimeji]
MEVVNPRAALLSNFEVLTLLRELENDHITRAKVAVRVKKEEDAAGHPARSTGGDAAFGEPSQNLRTVEVEAIQYLSADYLPTARQTPEGITKLVKELAPYDLTKAEKLQVVNLAPTLPVELYVIVEELEDRLGDRMEEILDRVKSTLSAAPAPRTQPVEAYPVLRPSDESFPLNESLMYPDETEPYQGETVKSNALSRFLPETRIAASSYDDDIRPTPRVKSPDDLSPPPEVFTLNQR